jgi:acyl-coenzyme A synthetase/AMP-(fatty) acid ligase
LALTPDTPAFINYTSGTTGQPKGALQGHRSMLGHAGQRDDVRLCHSWAM